MPPSAAVTKRKRCGRGTRWNKTAQKCVAKQGSPKLKNAITRKSKGKIMTTQPNTKLNHIMNCDIYINLNVRKIITQMQFEILYSSGKTLIFSFAKPTKRGKYRLVISEIITDNTRDIFGSMLKAEKYMKTNGYEMPTYHSIVTNLRTVTSGSGDVIYKQKNEPCPENVLDVIREIYPEEQVILL